MMHTGTPVRAILKIMVPIFIEFCISEILKLFTVVIELQIIPIVSINVSIAMR